MLNSVVHGFIYLVVFYFATPASSQTSGGLPPLRREAPTTMPAAPSPLATAGTASPIVVDSYVNSRFGFVVEYPSQIFFPRGESDNGDGQSFLSKEGDAKLTVWGGWAGFGPCDAINTAASYSGATVTYKWQKDGESIASGFTREGKFFHVKNILSGVKCVGLTLEYTGLKRATFEPLVSSIVGSLANRGGVGRL